MHVCVFVTPQPCNPKWRTRLTVVKVLQQALLAREVQFDADAEGEGDHLAGLQGEVGQRLLQVPAQELPIQLLCQGQEQQTSQ